MWEQRPGGPPVPCFVREPVTGLSLAAPSAVAERLVPRPVP